MEDAAVRALNLIEQGIAKMGEVGPELWERMVTYNLALTVANWVMFGLVGVAGVYVFVKVGYSSHRRFVEAKGNQEEVAAIAQGIIGYLIGFFAGLIGVVEFVGRTAGAIATIYAPDISLILSLVAKTK